MSIQIRNKARGFSLIEVMIAVLVLSFGLLALAALQGELFRAGAEAKARANATTLAQQVIEDARGFAFVAPPSGTYTGPTYQSLANGNWTVNGIGGVNFSVNRQVVRYRYNRTAGAFQLAAAGDPFQLNIPEYKLVRVNVTWPGGDGTNKSITLTDSIAAVSPSDITQVMDEPSDSRRGPSVYIEPPNKGNPQVVPIAIGPDQAAASSNPTPEQFVEDVSAVTRFSVMSFSGNSADEVLLTRKLDMAAASCVCKDNGATSSATNPAYQPTVWSGKALRYNEPAVVTGSPVGAAVVANADSEVETLCTVCCRDHHVYASRTPPPDPWRASVGGDSTAAHYGYKQQGNAFNISGGLLPTSDTGGVYLDACQLTRVNGRMRMMVDANQTAMVVTPLNDAGTGYRNADFVSRFSGFVTGMLTENLGTGAMPSGYPSAAVPFPAPSATINATYSDILSPAAIALSTTGEKKTLVSFGVYVDYLSKETLDAYACALKADNDTSDPNCAGLTARNPLEVLPFYAVNVASLGDWSSANPAVATVQTGQYNNQGRLATIGGVVTAGSATSATAVPMTISINRSNSGLAGTAAIDKHDELAASYVSDAQGFTRSGGSGTPPTINTLFVNTIASSTLSVNAFNIAFGGSACAYSKQDKVTSCLFTSPYVTSTLVISNYVTETKVKGVSVINDRKVCLPPVTDVRISTPVVASAGTLTESTTVTITGLLPVNYTMLISVVDQASTCPASGLSLTP